MSRMATLLSLGQSQETEGYIEKKTMHSGGTREQSANTWFCSTTKLITIVIAE